MDAMNMKVKELNNKSIDFRRGLISGVTGFVFTILVFLISSLLIFISIIPEGAIKSIVFLTTLAAGFFSGYLTSKNVPMYGLFNGIISGIIYFLIIFISNMLILARFSFSINVLYIFLTVIIASAIGGITGINVRANRRRRKR